MAISRGASWANDASSKINDDGLYLIKAYYRTLILM